MAEACVHNTAFCCASVGYGPYQNITNLGVLIPSIFDAVRRVWLKKVSGGGASKPFLGVSPINQQQNIEMLTRCSAVLCGFVCSFTCFRIRPSRARSSS
jgi:hypothetical protein